MKNMKIAVTAKGENLEAELDPRFGRCQFFLLIDSETMQVESISNESVMASGGAGIQAAQNIIKTGAKIVLTGNIGPNAFQTLSAAGVKVYTGNNGLVGDVLNKWKNDQLKETSNPTVGSHSGLGF